MLITHATTKRWTREEFYRLCEQGFFGPDDRVELIEGEIVVLPPPSPEHSAQIRKGVTSLVRLYGETHEICCQLPLDISGSFQPQPDFALVPIGATEDKVHPSVVDLVIEVALSSLDYDKLVKLPLYAQAGIPEYWVIDLKNRLVEVYRDPALLSDSKQLFGYKTKQILRPDDQVQPLKVPGEACSLAVFFS